MVQITIDRPSKALKVLVATPFGRGGRGGMDRLTDIIIDTLRDRPDLHARAEALTTYGPGSKFWMPFVFCGCLIRLLTMAIRRQVDVVHVNVAAGASIYRKAFLASVLRILGIPYVVHIHGSRFHESWPKGGLLSRRPADWMFIGSAEIIVLGRSWASLIADNLPSVRAKITILPNATQSIAAPDVKKLEAAPVHISFLGALGPRKGTPQLIEALARLKGLGDWQATIAGNGDVNGFKKRAQDLGIGERVRFPGWLGPEEARDLLNRSHIFVLPSFAENLPMAILEAFAHGVAVISTPVGAIPEVVEDGRTGLIVPVGDVDALADALRQLIENPALRRSLGDAARAKHAEQYDMGQYIVKLTQIWRRAVDMKKNAGV